MDLLKQRFLQRRIVDSIRNFKQLFDDLYSLSHPNMILKPENFKYMVELGGKYDTLTVHIRKLIVIKMASVVVSRIHRYIKFNNIVIPKINEKVLLSSYLISGFPEFVLSRQRYHLNQPISDPDITFDIYQISYELINNINKITNGTSLGIGLPKQSLVGTNSVVNLITSFIKYSNCFVLWSNQDKLEKINQYLESWYNSQITINNISNSVKYDEEQKSGSVEAITKMQKKLVDQIKSFNPDFDIGILDAYYQIHSNLDDSINKAYWDAYSSKLEENNQVIYTQLEEAIVELKKIRTNEQFHAKLDDMMTKFVAQELTNSSILDILDYLVKTVILLQSAGQGTESLELWKNLRDNVHYLGDWKQFTPKLMEFLFVQIKELKDDIMSLYAIMSLGIPIV